MTAQAHRALHELARDRDVEALRAAVAAGASVDEVDERGSTPLHHAAEAGHADVVALLLEHGADPNVIAGEVPEYLGDHGSHWVEKGTPLHYAAREAHGDVVELLLAHGADPHGRSARRAWMVESPLAWALSEDRGELAASPRRAQTVGRLLDAGANPNERFEDAPSFLHRAVREEALAIVEALLSRGAKVNARAPSWKRADRDEGGETPLHVAIEAGSAEIVRALVAHGASFKLRDASGRLPVDCLPTVISDELLDAIESGEHRIALETLLDRDRLDRVKAALEDTKDPRGRRAPLTSLLLRGFVSEVRAAVAKKKRDPRLAGEDGARLLVCAARLGHADIVEMLLAKPVPESGAESFFVATCEGGLVELVEARASAALPRELDEGLARAAGAGRVEVVAALLAHRPDVDAWDALTMAALAPCSSEARLEIVDSLLAAGATPRPIDRQDLARSRIAADDPAVARIRARAGELTVPEPALREAIQRAATEELRAHLARETGAVHPELLVEAIMAISAPVVELLLDHGAAVNARDPMGWTPLHHAVHYYSQAPVITLLLDRGAERAARNRDGKRPIDLATSDAIRQLLENRS